MTGAIIGVTGAGVGLIGAGVGVIKFVTVGQGSYKKATMPNDEAADILTCSVCTFHPPCTCMSFDEPSQITPQGGPYSHSKLLPMTMLAQCRLSCQ